MTLRAWTVGGEAPAPEALMKAEAADGPPERLYAVRDGVEEGEWASIVQSLRARMEGVHDNPASLRSYSVERSGAAFAAGLFNLAQSRRERAQLLQQLGVLNLDAGDPTQKERAARVLADREGGQGPESWAALAAELSALWEPRGLLTSVLGDPAAVAASVVARLDPGHDQPLAIWGHSFSVVARHLLEPLARSHTVAYARDTEIHVVTAIRDALNDWDADAHLQVGAEDVPLIEVLLVHEVVEIILEETTELPPPASHLVAATMGRCLRDTMLDIAVEAFCLDWLESVPESATGKGDAEGGVASDPDLSEEEAAAAERDAATRTDSQERELLEEMFADEPADEPAGSPVESGAQALEPDPAIPQRPEPERPEHPEPVIRSTAGGGEDLAAMFDDEEEPQAPGGRGAAAEAGDETDGRRKRTYQFDAVEGDGPRVLVVDDSSMTRHLVCEVVRKLGCQPIEATDGVQAVAMGRFHKPGLIVLDIAMPGGNGLAALSQLRESQECATTPIIMLTVDSGRDSIQGAIRQGANDYLIKPVNVSELSKRITQHLGL